MLGWILQGLRTRIVTTRYPARPEPQPDGVRNRLVLDAARCRPAGCRPCAEACPTGALTVVEGRVRVDLGRCIQCGLCVERCPGGALSFAPDYELAVRERADLITEAPDGRG